MGRGVGGRATTRTTREIADLKISHGAPVFHVTLQEAKELVSLLEGQGSVARWTGTVGRVDAVGAAAPGGVASRGASEDAPIYTGVPTMSAVADGILKLAADCELKPSTKVADIKRHAEGMELCDDKGTSLGQFDWVVVSSKTPLTKRWTEVFGSPMPVASAAAGKAALSGALEEVAKVETIGVHVAMAAWKGDGVLSSLPFDVTHWDNPVFSKVVRSVSGQYSVVVIHSTPEFSARHKSTIGSIGSSANNGAVCAGEPEGLVLYELINAFRTAAKKMLGEIGDPAFGPLLHRWGGAFPTSGLASPVASDGLCMTGDFVGDRPGSVESAMRAGILGAEAVVREHSKR